MNAFNNIALLCEEIAKGDQDAYRRLYLHYYTKLFRFVKGFTRNRELSEEIVSDVFINLWRRRQHIREINNLNVYLYVSARNITFNYLKKLNRENLINLDDVEVEPEAPFSDPGQVMITREMNTKIKEAINQLPPRCKLIFIMVKEHGLTYKQTAQVLHLAESTVENQLSIALKKIAGTIRFTLPHL